MLGSQFTPQHGPRDLVRGLRAPSAAASRVRPASRLRSSRSRSASRCACSGCAGTSTAGTATARPTSTTSRWAADANGKIVAADWTTYGQAGSTIDTTKELLGTAVWPAAPAAGGPTPSDTGIYGATGYGPSYIYQRRVLAKTQPLYGGSLKISALRAPNAPQSYFASEQIVDELAHAAGMDPVAFRKLNIDGTSVLGARWLSGAGRRDDRCRLEAEGRCVQPAERQRGHRPRLRHGDVRVQPVRRRRRHPGDQEAPARSSSSTSTSPRTTGSRSARRSSRTR